MEAYRCSILMNLPIKMCSDGGRIHSAYVMKQMKKEIDNFERKWWILKDHLCF